MDRILIAERGTDWLRALRCLSLAHRPFTTLVQAHDDEGFLREAPWGAVAPKEVVLLCASALTAGVMESRLALLRHVSSLDRTVVHVVADSDEGALASRAFLEVVRDLAPGLEVRVSTLAALGTPGVPEEPLQRAA